MRPPRVAFARAGLLLDAGRQVTWRQALHRPRRLVPPRLIAGRAPSPGRFRPFAGGLAIDDAPQSGPLPPPHLDGVFRALGSERDAGDPELWSRMDEGLLFLFELHAFQDLSRYAGGERTAAGDAFWAGVLGDWLTRYGGRPEAPAWHPYALSGRVLAWCAALSAGGWPDRLTEAMVSSLSWQLKLLRRSVEHEIGGNHVLRNASALVVGGVCCGDAAAARRGRSVFARELPRQVLPDGGHEERAPSYSRIVHRDLAAVAEVERRAGRPPSEPVRSAVERMGRALAALAGPDGRLPLLNDGWDGPPMDGDSRGPLDLADSGYVVLRDGTDQAVLDVGLLCPPHLPPHAHADALSFVLWADGRPVVVDPGSGGYEHEDREWSRATRIHATVEVDGRDQCVFWGDFRASKLPRVERGRLEERPGTTVLTAWHDGYRRLADPVEHVRTFCWLPGDGLVVVDRLRAREPHDVLSSLPLATGGPAPLRIASLGDAPLGERTGRLAPYFGVFQENTVLEQRARVQPGEPFGWALTRSEATVRADGKQIEVLRPGRDPVTFTAPL